MNVEMSIESCPTCLMVARMQEIEVFYRTCHRMPSAAELRALFNFRSRRAVDQFLASLLEAGYIARNDRGRLVPLFKTPWCLIGLVEAGFPSPAEEELGDTITLDELLVGNRSATVMLKVSGDSMVGAGIMPGDTIIVDRSIAARPGHIVIAQIDGHWTMKYLIREKGRYLLRADNPKYPDMHPERELKIHGVVFSSFRRFL